MSRFHLIAIVACLGCTLARAQTPAPVPDPAAFALTIVGDPTDASSDTVVVNPIPVEDTPERRVMTIKTSRSMARVNWDGLRYRSYIADVRFDCPNRNAYFISVRFFKLPLWKGDEIPGLDFSKLPPRRVEFRDFQPNPLNRLIRAACA